MKKLIIIFVLLLAMPFCGNALIFTATNDDGVEIKYKTVGSDHVQVIPNNYTGFVRIPETVTYEDVTYTVVEITTSAFTNCSGLQYVQLPATITNVGNSAFRGCDDLDSIRILAVTPPSTNSMGLSLNASQLSRLVIIVPDGCIKAYRENRWWSNDNRIPLNITSDNHTRLTIMLPTGYEVKFGYKDSWNKTPYRTAYFSDYYTRDSYDIIFFYTFFNIRR